MVAGLEGFLGVSFVLVAGFALLWRFSSLPDLQWNFIVSGTMLFLAVFAVGMIGDLSVFNIDPSWTTPVMAIGNIVGGLLVLIGAIQNAVSSLQQK